MNRNRAHESRMSTNAYPFLIVALSGFIALMPLFGETVDLPLSVLDPASGISRASSDGYVGVGRREIVLSGSKVLLPYVQSSQTSQGSGTFTILEIANVTDSAATFSFRIRDADGDALSMPFYNFSNPSSP